MPPAVSLIVPIHNTAPWLKRCVDSLLAQSLRDMEIILVDDGSTDASPAIAAAYGEVHPGTVRHIRLATPQGPGAARNAGLAAARGEFVGFADSDDYVAPDMYECLYTRAVHEGAHLAVCGTCEVYGGGTREFLPRAMDAPALLKDRRVQASACNKIFLRSRLEQNGILFPRSYFAEDMAFVVKFLVTEPAIAVVEKALYFYEKRDSSLTFSLARRRWALVSLRDLRLHMRHAGVHKKFAYAYHKHFFLQAVYYPACLLLIDSVCKGRNLRENARALPGYLAALARFLRGKEV